MQSLLRGPALRARFLAGSLSTVRASVAAASDDVIAAADAGSTRGDFAFLPSSPVAPSSTTPVIRTDNDQRRGSLLAGVHTSAAGAVASPEEVLANWAAEDGQGQHGDRQQAVSRTSAWRGTGDLNQPLDLSSRSLTALPAPILAEVRRLNVDHNQLDSLPETLSTGLQRL